MLSAAMNRCVLQKKYLNSVSGIDRDGKTRGWNLGNKGKGRLHGLTDSSQEVTMEIRVI